MMKMIKMVMKLDDDEASGMAWLGEVADVVLRLFFFLL